MMVFPFLSTKSFPFPSPLAQPSVLSKVSSHLSISGSASARGATRATGQRDGRGTKSCPVPTTQARHRTWQALAMASSHWHPEFFPSFAV